MSLYAFYVGYEYIALRETDTSLSFCSHHPVCFAFFVASVQKDDETVKQSHQGLLNLKMAGEDSGEGITVSANVSSTADQDYSHLPVYDFHKVNKCRFFFFLLTTLV